MDIQRRNEYDYEHKELIGTGSGGNRVYKIQDVHSKKVMHSYVNAFCSSSLLRKYY